MCDVAVYIYIVSSIRVLYPFPILSYLPIVEVAFRYSCVPESECAQVQLAGDICHSDIYSTILLAWLQTK